MASVVDITRATEEDFEILSQIQPEAMDVDLIGRFIFKDLHHLPQSRQFTLAGLYRGSTNPNVRMFKATTKDTHEVVAYAVVRFEDGAEVKEDARASLPPEINPEFCKLIWGGLNERYTKHMGGKKHAG